MVCVHTRRGGQGPRPVGEPAHRRAFRHAHGRVYYPAGCRAHAHDVAGGRRAAAVQERAGLRREDRVEGGARGVAQGAGAALRAHRALECGLLLRV